MRYTHAQGSTDHCLNISLFNDSVSTRCGYHHEWGIGEDLEASGLKHFKVPSQNYPGETEKNYEEISVFSSNPAEIGTRYLPNSSALRYHHTCCLIIEAEMML